MGSYKQTIQTLNMRMFPKYGPPSGGPFGMIPTCYIMLYSIIFYYIPLFSSIFHCISLYSLDYMSLYSWCCLVWLDPQFDR